jgi:replicative DNA helicase
MGKSKYVDIPSIIQVIGNVYTNTKLLEDDRYVFTEEDFTEEFHKIIFGTIYNLFNQGIKTITIHTIEDYLKDRPDSYAIYQVNKGGEWIGQLVETVQPAAFSYYYQRMKKMTLLRMYDKSGLDVSDLYDVNNVLDLKKRKYQEDWLDNHSLEEIANVIDDKILLIRERYVDNVTNDFIQAGEGAETLIEKLKKEPAIGVPLYGDLINGVVRGARLKKFYLRSASTGVGKTRSMIADICFIGCDEIYDKKSQKWIRNGTKEPCLFISTEQDEEEIQTMMLAFLSNVTEGHIIDGKYLAGEEDRVHYAAKLLAKCPIYIKKLPDFSLQDIEATIKSAIREWDVKYIFHDYIHTSMKILSEISEKAGIKSLREDNILFMISVRLKDICNEYGVFIMSATQLNGDYMSATVYDQNVLRGAKAIADKIDVGMIMLEVTQEDRKALENLTMRPGFDVPDIKIPVYKNRRGQYKGILLWCKADRGTCRINPMYATNYNFELVKIDDFKVTVV